jgi:tripartite-type tricarboxylate transporter receptor subunit TctC
MNHRRTFARTLLVAAFALLGCSAATADYPDRNITLVVPFAPGGTTDIVARLVGEHMGKTLGRSIVVENDAGAGGTVASRRVAQAAADGYTLMIGTLGTHGAGPSQYPNLKYDPRRDFTPIGQTSEMPFVLVTRKDFPINTLKEFVEYVKRNQDKVSEAHAGVGSEIHAACTLLQSIIGTKTARVAYRGGAPAINDVVAGQVDFACKPWQLDFPHQRMRLAERASLFDEKPLLQLGEQGRHVAQVGAQGPEQVHGRGFGQDREVPQEFACRVGQAFLRALEQTALDAA